MKIVKNVWNTLSNPLPNEHYPLIAMYSNREIAIEQVEKLLSFTEHHISIYCLLGTVHINGDHLSILFMNQNELIVRGTITEVKFDPNAERKE